MDKETLSHYGWIVVLVLILSVMIAMAAPFGSFVAGAIKSTTVGLFSVNQAALGSAGIDVNDMAFENCNHLETEIRNASDVYTGDICCKNCGKVLTAGEIDDGYNHGAPELHPNNGTTPKDGDIYSSQHPYRYTYSEEDGGWSVKIIGTSERERETYPPILESINGKPIVSMPKTFENCRKMTKSPAIPKGVRYMRFTYQYCYGLTETPILPNGVEDLSYTFYLCTALTDVSKLMIPASVTEMTDTFSNCTSLTIAPDMSKATSVSIMNRTFRVCESLTTVSTMPPNVTKIDDAFSYCRALSTLPQLPNSVTELPQAFSNCTSTTDLSDFVIPNGVTNLSATFSDCTSLVKAPKIPSNVKSLGATFDGCTSLIIAPELPDGVTNMRNTFYGCTSLTTAPILPNGAEDIWSVFNGCTSLKTYHGNTDPDGDFSNYKIPDTVTDMSYAFFNCTLLTKAPILSDNIAGQGMYRAFEGCSSLTGTIKIPICALTKLYTFTKCPATIEYYHVSDCNNACGH